ncbi:MAG: hypothetical protein WA728_25570 [Xanthobacteraceae bacterium]
MEAPQTTPRQRTERELIAHWIKDIKKHHRWKVWKQIQDHAPTFPWLELINAVLHTRHSAWITADRLRAWSEWRQEMKKGFDDALSGAAHNQDPAAIIELLEHALLETRFRFGDFKYVDEASAKFNFSQKVKFTAEQRLFVQILVNYFTKSFERPFHEAVATLAEIAFPGLELSVPDVANIALRATTKQGRSKRPR